MSKVTRFFRQFLVLIPIYVNAIFSGMGYSWLASYMTFLQSEEHGIPYTIQQCTILALLLHIGRISGAFMSIFVLGKLGRKIPLILANSLFLTSAGMVLVSTAYLAVALARFVNGFANGLYECFGTIYLGEIPSKSIRGTLSSTVTAVFSIGILAQYALGTYLSYSDGAILRVTLAILLALSGYYLVESPYYLKPLNPDEALKTISWLRAIKPKQAEKELEDIGEIDHNTTVEDFFKHFKKPEIYKSFSLSLSLGFLSTILSVVFYSFANFIIPVTKTLNSHQFAILLNIIPTAMCFLSAVAIDYLGRRLLLLVGFSLGIFLNTLITLLYYLEETSILRLSNFPWIIFFITVLFLITYSLSIAPTVNALRTEIFPNSHKVLGISLTIIFNAIAFLFGTIFFLRVVKVYGMHLNFLIYCICCFVGLILVKRCLPETKGKSLDEIQEILKGNNKLISEVPH